MHTEWGLHLHDPHFTIKSQSRMDTHLKIASKRPAPQHLKKRVVIVIFSYVIKIVVFASSTDTFLTVYSKFQLSEVTVWINCAKNDWLELKQKIPF